MVYQTIYLVTICDWKYMMLTPDGSGLVFGPWSRARGA